MPRGWIKEKGVGSSLRTHRQKKKKKKKKLFLSFLNEKRLLYSLRLLFGRPPPPAATDHFFPQSPPPTTTTSTVYIRVSWLYYIFDAGVIHDRGAKRKRGLASLFFFPCTYFLFFPVFLVDYYYYTFLFYDGRLFRFCVCVCVGVVGCVIGCLHQPQPEGAIVTLLLFLSARWRQLSDLIVLYIDNNFFFFPVFLGFDRCRDLPGDDRAAEHRRPTGSSDEAHVQDPHAHQELLVGD